jgi:hypothetical protein
VALAHERASARVAKGLLSENARGPLASLGRVAHSKAGGSRTFSPAAPRRGQTGSSLLCGRMETSQVGDTSAVGGVLTRTAYARIVCQSRSPVGRPRNVRGTLKKAAPVEPRRSDRPALTSAQRQALFPRTSNENCDSETEKSGEFTACTPALSSWK